MKKIAVVILNWNGSQMLKQYLPVLLKHVSADTAVYVADNASTDDSVQMLKQQFPEVSLITFEENYGFADGYNKALQQIEATYYVLLNSDVEVTENWLSPLVDFMDTHPEYAACQPKLLSIADRKMFEYAGAAGGYIDKLGYPYCRGRIFDKLETDHGQYNTIADVHWATGACMMVRREKYNEIGGLDGRFFAHCEEIDFCWRLRLAGYKIACIPTSKVFHVGGATLSRSNPTKTFLNFRNNLTMLYKNLPEKELRIVMIKRWFLDYLAAYQTLILNRKVGDFKAIYRARKAFKAWKDDFKADRENIQAHRRIDGAHEKSRFSILWKYYVNHNRFYSDL